MTGNTRARKALLAARRLQVADYLLLRTPQARIAKELGVSQATVSRDVAHILATWEADLEGKTGRIRAREIQDLERMEYDTLVQRAKALLLRDAAPQSSREWEVYDKSARSWSQQRLEIKKRRSELLGLDQQPQPQTQPDAPPRISFIQIRPPTGYAPDPPLRLESGGEVINGETVDREPVEAPSEYRENHLGRVVESEEPDSSEIAEEKPIDPFNSGVVIDRRGNVISDPQGRMGRRRGGSR